MRTLINLESVKSGADLLQIVRTSGIELKKVASTNGGEFAGACPMCGGHDRFRVQPNASPYPLWMCRHCTGGKWDTVIGYIAKRDNLAPKKREDLAEICRRVVGEVPTTNRQQPDPVPIPAYQAPDDAWQASALQVIAECEATLWKPKYSKVLDYLHDRGLQEATIRHFRLGYCSTGKEEAYGREIAGLYIPRGIVIPCLAAAKVWYLKIRLVPGVPCPCQNCKVKMPQPGICQKCGKDTRYLGVKGNKTAAIFGADELTTASMALFVEGEIDAMTGWQEFGEIIPTVTIGGGATNRLDLATWGAYLIGLQSILISYDSDRAGQNGAEWLVQLSEKVRLAPLPEGEKDLNAFHQSGGDLMEWILNYFTFYSSPFFSRRSP